MHSVARDICTLNTQYSILAKIYVYNMSYVRILQHPAGNELCSKWLTSLPDDCYIESHDSFPLMAHQQLLAPV